MGNKPQMSLNAPALEVSPHLHHVLEAGHGLKNIFGNILLAMHNNQRVSYEELLHIHKLVKMFYTYASSTILSLKKCNARIYTLCMEIHK